MKSVKNCSDCNTSTYNMKCLHCLAVWILMLDKNQRLRSIELNGKHDIDDLKAEVIRLNR